MSKRRTQQQPVATPSEFADWDVGSNYEVEKIIGVGSYGSVCRALQKSTGKKVAIKRMQNIFEDEVDCKRILREITLLRKLDHPAIVKVLDILEPRDQTNFTSLYVVMEYMESDIKKIVRSPINLELLHIQTILFRLFSAVKSLHDANVIHRDIKPANVLIREDCSIKLCDFGLARQIDIDDVVSTTELSVQKPRIVSPVRRGRDDRVQATPTQSKFLRLASMKPTGGPPGLQVTSPVMTANGQNYVDDASQSSAALGDDKRGVRARLNKSKLSPAVGSMKATGLSSIQQSVGISSSQYSRFPGSTSILNSPQPGEYAKISQAMIEEEKRAQMTKSKLDQTYATAVAAQIQSPTVGPTNSRNGALTRGIKKDLTKHVVSRWYRAPEIILLDKNYGAPVDIWALGCVFAELLGMIQENQPDYTERKPFFPGESCFPLSPCRKRNVVPGGNQFPNEVTDQLNVIFDVIGTPDASEYAHITEKRVLYYLSTFAQRNCQDFKSLLPAASDESLDLLKKMLAFSPKSRYNIDECLRHPFFDKVRHLADSLQQPSTLMSQAESAYKKRTQSLLNGGSPATNFQFQKASTKDLLEFEREITPGKELTKSRLRELLLKEIGQYRTLKRRVVLPSFPKIRTSCAGSEENDGSTISGPASPPLTTGEHVPFNFSNGKYQGPASVEPHSTTKFF